MPCVGNDVVDLKEPANAQKSINSRFLKKIITDNEIEFVNKSENPEESLWSFWSCKETAYKVIIKSFPDIAFLPRLWQTVFIESSSKHSEGEVIIPDRASVFVRLFSNSRYVHCIGADNASALDKIIWSVEDLPEGNADSPSIYLRKCLGRKLADKFSVDFHDIEIKRIRKNGELQPPCIYIGKEKTGIDVSLSHDGRFVAYACHL